jgi:hypothetical protein
MPTHRERFFKRHNIPLDQSLSLTAISKLSGMPLKALQEVKKRGEGAWGNNLASVRIATTGAKNPNTKAFPRAARMSKNQWSFARVMAFVDKAPTVFTGADNDIRLKYGLS